MMLVDVLPKTAAASPKPLALHLSENNQSLDPSKSLKIEPHGLLQHKNSQAVSRLGSRLG